MILDVGGLAGKVVRVEAELDSEWVQVRVHRCADAVECAVHHLERCDHADGSLGDVGACDVDERLTFGDRIGGRTTAERISERDQLGTEWQVGGDPGGDRRKIEVQSDGVAARTEKRCVGQQSIEAFV